MIQNDLFTAIKERLLTAVAADVTPVRMVDWFNGQPDKLEGDSEGMDGYLFPLALVRFEAITWMPLGNGFYEGDGTLYVDLVQEGGDRFVSDGTITERARAGTMVENVQAVETALDGLRGTGFGPLAVAMNDVDHAYRKLRVDTLAFHSRWYKSNNRHTTDKPANDLAETQAVV